VNLGYPAFSSASILALLTTFPAIWNVAWTYPSNTDAVAYC
jgi:hypothetical protein